MGRPPGSKDKRPRKDRAYKLAPGEASWNRLWRQNHYNEKGLSFLDFRRLASLPCHYCGALPKAINCYGMTYAKHLVQFAASPCHQRWWDLQWIYANGIDKKVPTNDYSDLSNLLPCCKPCNWMKGVMSYDDFINQNKAIYQHQNDKNWDYYLEIHNSEAKHWEIINEQ